MKIKKGFTLIELIIVITIMGIAISAIFSMNIFGINSFIRGSDRYDLISETNLVSEYITKYIRYAHEVEVLSASDTIPDSSSIASTSPMDGYIFISNTSGKDVVNYRTKDSTITLGEFDTCSIIFTPAESGKSLSYTITTSIKDISFSVDSGIVPINMLIQGTSNIIDNTGTVDGVALRIRSGGSSPAYSNTLIFNPTNPPNGIVGTTYTAVYNLSASGGTSPYTFVVSEGSRLPYGMQLETNGRLTGKPIEPGTFSVGIKVTDSSIPQKSATNFFDITIENTAVINDDAPVVSNLVIKGPDSIIQDRTAARGIELTADYDYYDEEGEPESGSIIAWWRGDDSLGTNLSQITGATTVTYTPVNEDVNKYIYVSVTPHSTDSSENDGNIVYCEFPVKIVLGEANSKPVASNVTIARSGNTLTGDYDYSDADGDYEGLSKFQWYNGKSYDGSDKEKLAGATSKTFSASNAYNNTYFFFEVTPRAQTGILEGDAVLSSSYHYKNNAD
jgi:prepilin-type N-terminal cleavage/methylation domain-containing protein